MTLDRKCGASSIPYLKGSFLHGYVLIRGGTVLPVSTSRVLRAKLRNGINRLRCRLRGWHVYDASGVGKFRYDVDGICHDCGVVRIGKAPSDD